MAQTGAADTRSIQEEAGRVPRASACSLGPAAQPAELLQGKLRTAGYRMVYQVDDKVVVVIMVAVGKRDKGTIYRTAGKRTKG